MTPSQLVIIRSVLAAERDSAARRGSDTKAEALQAGLDALTPTAERYRCTGAAFEEVTYELDDELMDGTIAAGELCCRIADRAITKIDNSEITRESA